MICIPKSTTPKQDVTKVNTMLYLLHTLIICILNEKTYQNTTESLDHETAQIKHTIVVTSIYIENFLIAAYNTNLSFCWIGCTVKISCDIYLMISALVDLQWEGWNHLHQSHQ